MKRALVGLILGLLLAPAFACEKKAAADITVERLPEVKPSLPAVPTLPPPPFPVTNPDSSYTVWGLRKKGNITMDTDVEVSGYIVEIYQAPPECPKDQICKPPAAPHAWISDTTTEKDPMKRLAVVGYAENQKAVDEAIAKAKHGAYKPPDPETGQVPIPTDFAIGNKIKVKGRFTRVSGSGFNISNGLMEYQAHTTLSVAAPPS